MAAIQLKVCCRRFVHKGESDEKSIFCVGIGAGLMYLFDPELGEVRRGLLMDKLQGVLPRTKDAISSRADAVVAKAGELTEKADSVAAETIQSLGGDGANSPEDSGQGSNSETASQQ
jgi:hypothetical protein